MNKSRQASVLRVLIPSLLVILFFAGYGSSRLPVPAIAASHNYACGTSLAPDQVVANTELTNSYQAWKTKYVTASGGGGYLRVQRPRDNNDTISEGIGYGMILAAYMDDKPAFDGLWNYAKTHFNSNGLMHWHINASNIVIGENGATDADEDMALALIVADKKWGGYRTAAVNLITSIRQHEIEASTYVLKPGDMWGGTDSTNPSYFAPAYYKVFQAYVGDASWNSITNAAYQIVAKVNAKSGASITGLQPNWTTAAGDPVSGMSYDYTYDATRVPWRLAKDAAWFCESRASSQLAKINTFFKNIGATAIRDGYELDGTVIGQYHSVAFVGPAAAAAIISSETAYRTAIWDEMVTLADSGDYNDTLRLLSLLFVSGHMPNPLTIGSDTSTTTPTSALSVTSTPISTQVSPTVTPITGSKVAYLPVTMKPFPPEWRDDFNDGQLNTQWWQPASNSSVIYEQNGVLNLRVTSEQSQNDNVYAQILSVPADRPIEQISFTTMLQSYVGTAEGGAGISANTLSGPFVQTSVGPGTSGPWLDLSICRQSTCSTYEDFDHPSGQTIQPNVPIAIRLTRTAGKIELYVNGEAVIQEVTSKQIMNFHFSIYAPQGKSFHVIVDDLHVILSNG